MPDNFLTSEFIYIDDNSQEHRLEYITAPYSDEEAKEDGIERTTNIVFGLIKSEKRNPATIMTNALVSNISFFFLRIRKCSF